MAVITDRLSGQIHPLSLPGNKYPIRISLSPDARQLAMELTGKGTSRIELFNLQTIIEPDEPIGIRGSTSLNQSQ